MSVANARGSVLSTVLLFALILAGVVMTGIHGRRPPPIYTQLQAVHISKIKAELQRAPLPKGTLLLTRDGRLQKIWGPHRDGKQLWDYGYEERGALAGINSVHEDLLERSVKIIRPTDSDYSATAAEYLQQKF